VQPEERFSKALRAIAGLANNKGGYLLFGIADGSFQADGLADDAFTKSDISLVNRVLVGALDPVPHVTKGLIELGGKQIGVLYVEKHDQRSGSLDQKTCVVGSRGQLKIALCAVA
jgi:predicted HTH transcriptional regulator